MILSRRRFFSLLAAPAIVHIGNLMPVKALADDGFAYDALGNQWEAYTDWFRQMEDGSLDPLYETIRWSPVPGAVSYNVYRGPGTLLDIGEAAPC